MIFNDKNFGIGNIEAGYNYWIKITSKDEKKRIFFCFSHKFDFNDLELNKKIDLDKYIYEDLTLTIDDTYYLFFLEKDTVFLTKIDNNKFRLEVDINKPNIIYTPSSDNSFKSLKIDTILSFDYNFKPKRDKSLLTKPIKKSNINIMDVLDKI